MQWRHMREWQCSSTPIDLGTRWSLVVSFTTRPLYLQGKSPSYLLDRMLCGHQSRSGRRGEEKSFAPVGNGTRTVQPIASLYRPTDWSIEFSFEMRGETHVGRHTKCLLFYRMIWLLRPVWLKCIYIWCLYMSQSINDHLQKANDTLRKLLLHKS
jgi:hypothetical protein